MQLIQNPPDVLVDVASPFPAWAEEEKTPVHLVSRAVKEVFNCSPLPAIASKLTQLEVSVLLGNNDLVQTLNREYRDKYKPTNVLSFPQVDFSDGAILEKPDSGPFALGDIILAFETVKSESEEKLIPLESHVCHLVVHGTLHLLGYDHITDDQASQMEEMEIWIMRRLGHKNPYSW
jgi:probable rRNA maturation factor